ncbi:unnamed protein product [Brassica oleracea var. botrytis]
MRERGEHFFSQIRKKKIFEERSTFVGVFDSSKICRDGSNSLTYYSFTREETV